MEHLGIYERVIMLALQAEKPPPWSADDLERVRDQVTGEMRDQAGCSCDTATIRDWVNSLSDTEKGDLLDRLNGDVANGEARNGEGAEQQAA